MSKKNPKQKPARKNTDRLARYRRQLRRAEKDKAAARNFLNTVQPQIDRLLMQVAQLERDWPKMEKQHDEANARMVTAQHNIKCVESKARAEEKLASARTELRKLERAEREQRQKTI